MKLKRHIRLVHLPMDKDLFSKCVDQMNSDIYNKVISNVSNSHQSLIRNQSTILIVNGELK